MTEIGYHDEAYRSTPLEQKLAWFQNAPGLSAVEPARQFMSGAAALYTDSDSQVRATLRSLGADWTGEAATNAGTTLQRAADWSQDASAGHVAGGETVGGYGESFESLRGKVHWDDPWAWGWNDTASAAASAVTLNPAPFIGNLTVDYFATAQQNRTNDAAAVAALQAHESQTRTAVDSFPNIAPAGVAPSPEPSSQPGGPGPIGPLPTPPATPSGGGVGGVAGATAATVGAGLAGAAGLVGAGGSGAVGSGGSATGAGGPGVGPGGIPTGQAGAGRLGGGPGGTTPDGVPGAGPGGLVGGAPAAGPGGVVGGAPAGPGGLVGGAPGSVPGGLVGGAPGAGGAVGGRTGGVPSFDGRTGAGGVPGSDPRLQGGEPAGGVGARDGGSLRLPPGAVPGEGTGRFGGGLAPGEGRIGVGGGLIGGAPGGTAGGWRDVVGRPLAEPGLISRGPAAGPEFAARLPSGGVGGGMAAGAGMPFLGGMGVGAGAQATEHSNTYWVRSAEPFDVPLPPHVEAVLHGGDT